MSGYIIQILLLIGLPLFAQQGRYMRGDFHQHTTFTDGAYSFQYIMQKNFEFGLDWWANSEHGGAYHRDGCLSGTDLGRTFAWAQHDSIEIHGDTLVSGGFQYMWRWQSLKEYSFKALLEAREKYPGKLIIQGMEWNVPGHEHASMAILTGQFDTLPNVDALAQFEFMFDANDRDSLGGLMMYNWQKSYSTGHIKTLEALRWLNLYHPYNCWVVPGHPERVGKYSIAHFRDMNNTAPNVCFGFEGQPGHQKSPTRGNFGVASKGKGTFGGTGVYSAKIGGLWDALLSEGRGWWFFASSDFHNYSVDFFPGEYQKIYTYVKHPYTARELYFGLRLGNSWVVTGDLIDSLIFEIDGATMGKTFSALDDSVTISIKARDPDTTNNNTYSDYKNPVLDHIDLIMGKVNKKISPDDTMYFVDWVNTTKIIARFDSLGGIIDSNNITSIKWNGLSDGWKEMTLRVKLDERSYFRLRGSNLKPGDTLQVDFSGNPLSDTLTGNNAALAYGDLWFYSNPVFVNPKGYELSKEMPPPELKTTFFPNPVQNTGYIYFDSIDKAGLTIVNVQGSVLHKKVLDAPFSKIDLSWLDKGIYFLTLQQGNKQKTIKILKTSP